MTAISLEGPKSTGLVLEKTGDETMEERSGGQDDQLCMQKEGA